MTRRQRDTMAAFDRAREIQERADAIALHGQFWTAAALFDEAAAYAVTPEGAACLRAKAREARAQIDRIGGRHAY